MKSEGVTDESKCAYMERLVRDELERWESESSISGFDQSTSSRGQGSGRGGQAPQTLVERVTFIDLTW